MAINGFNNVFTKFNIGPYKKLYNEKTLHKKKHFKNKLWKVLETDIIEKIFINIYPGNLKNLLKIYHLYF